MLSSNRISSIKLFNLNYRHVEDKEMKSKKFISIIINNLFFHKRVEDENLKKSSVEKFQCISRVYRFKILYFVEKKV